MAAKKLIHDKLKAVYSLPCIHVKEQTVIPKRSLSVPQLTTCTEISVIRRLHIFQVRDDSLKPAICEWESFPPYAKQLLQDSLEKPPFSLGN